MGDSANPDWTTQWQAAARPWLDAWKDLAQGRAAPAAPARQDGFEQWARLFATGSPQGETIERMVDSARSHAAFMQSMLGALSSAPPGGTNWADALRSSLVQPAMFEHPMAQAWRDGGEQARQFFAQFMRVPDLPSMSAMPAMPAMPNVPADAWRALLDLPAFGSMREHQEHYQATGRAWLDYRAQMERYNKLMLDAAQRGFAHFERKLAEREQPGRQIESLRALYDLWVDAAEDGYAEVALSAEFREAYGALVNAQMRVRSQMQKDVERMSREFGMPTRSEVDSIGQRLQALRREVRANGSLAPLMDEVAALRRELADLKAAHGKAARTAVAASARADEAADADEAVLHKVASPRKRPAPARAERKPAAKSAPSATKPAARAMSGSAAGSFASRIGKYAESSLGASRSKPAKKAAATRGKPATKRTTRRTDKGNA